MPLAVRLLQDKTRAGGAAILHPLAVVPGLRQPLFPSPDRLSERAHRQRILRFHGRQPTVLLTRSFPREVPPWGNGT